jgi:hypothetical protein
MSSLGFKHGGQKMSKRLSIFCTTAFVVVALLGSAVLLPALHSNAPQQVTSGTVLQRQADTLRRESAIEPSLKASPAHNSHELVGTPERLIDYTLIFPGD